MRNVPRWVGLLVFIASTAAVLSASDSNQRAAPTRPLVHPEPGSAERELLAVVHALIRDEAAPARAAMDRLKVAVRALPAEETDLQGSDVLVYSQAFRAALNRARESAGAGQVMQAFDDFYWVQRSCRQCHDAARQKGVALFGTAGDSEARPPSP